MSDQWSAPSPVAQQFPRQESDGIGRLVGIMRDQATRMREVTANLLRAMGVRARPGQMSSLDFDGTDRTHLGTTGWALVSDTAGGSYLVLNGIDVYADLAAKAAALAAQQTALSAAQAELANHQSALDDQLASINGLVGQQVKGWTGEASVDVSSYPYNGSTGVYATVNVPIPDGFSTAYISAVSSARGQALVGKDVGMRVKSIVNGNESREYLDGGSLGASVTAPHSVTVPGLSGGTVAVATRAGVTNALDTTSGWVTTTVTALFIR